MKLRVQAQHLQPGDIVNGGLVLSVNKTRRNLWVYFKNKPGEFLGENELINVERAEKENV
jgi:hypothetical protein